MSDTWNDSSPSAMHELEYIHTRDDGQQEWWCPRCGYHALIDWRNSLRTVIEPGDGIHGHYASYSAVRNEPNESDLSVWAEALDEMGFDQLWEE